MHGLKNKIGWWLATGLLICAGCTSSKSLKYAYRHDFKIGAALGSEAIDQKYPADIKNVKRHFNAISTAMLEWSTTEPQPGVFTFNAGDRFVRFGQKNHMFTIGHGLVWHQMVPAWVFQDSVHKPVTRTVLLQRLRAHIFAVVKHYKGKINAWIVVNEAIDKDGNLRKSGWQQIIGDDYLQKAFEYAHEADPQARLYYNDFALFTPAQRATAINMMRRFKAAGVSVDGIGLQAHWTLDHPSLNEVEASLNAFSRLGLKLMITELDISVLPRKNSGAEITDKFAYNAALNPYPDSLPKKVQCELAERYARIFELFHKYRQFVEVVSFWGINDRDSWRNDWPIKGRVDYPMLFDRNNQPKDAYREVINVVK